MKTHQANESILIKNARVIDPASGRDETADIAVQNGKISTVGQNLDHSRGHKVIDASDKIACPGLIDPHVHLRQPGAEHKETIATGSRAAAAGGFTSVCCMPNTSPCLDTPEMLTFVRTKAAESALCRVFPVAAATAGRKGEQPVEFNLCKQAGAVAFSDDGDVVESTGMMKSILTSVASLDSVFMQHCQDTALTRGAAMHAGDVSTRLGLPGWPREAEEIIIERDARLSKITGGRYHVQHISSGGSVEIVRTARAAGIPITAEASPHHLTLTHEACIGFNTAAKMNPPLREQSDIDAIIQGVIDGTITILATDHAPHAHEEKAVPFEAAPFGIIGLETALSIYAEVFISTKKLTWPQLIALITINPARLCGLDSKGLGTLAVGGPADITIIDPDAEWTLSPQQLAGKSTNTPFMGRSLRARASATIVGGVLSMLRENPADPGEFSAGNTEPAGVSS